MRIDQTVASPAGTRLTARSITRHVPTVGRVLMGLLFLIAGLNGFFNFLPQPSDPMPEGAANFAVALMKSGYMLQLVAATQAIAGALLLSNRFVPLALVLIAPVVVNIFAFHVFLAPAGLPIAIFVAAVEITLAWQHRAAFGPLFVARRATISASLQYPQARPENAPRDLAA